MNTHRRSGFPPIHAGLAQPEVLIPPRMRARARLSLAFQPGFTNPPGACIRVKCEFSCSLPRALDPVEHSEELRFLGGCVFPLPSLTIPEGRLREPRFMDPLVARHLIEAELRGGRAHAPTPVPYEKNLAFCSGVYFLRPADSSVKDDTVVATPKSSGCCNDR